MHSSFRSRGIGLDLHVLSWAPERPRRETIVLLHGFMDAAATWDLRRAGARRRRAYRVLAPDLRGYGSSDRVPGAATTTSPTTWPTWPDVLDEHVPGARAARRALDGRHRRHALTGRAARARRRSSRSSRAGPARQRARRGAAAHEAWLDDLERPGRRRPSALPKPMTEEDALARLQSDAPARPRGAAARRGSCTWPRPSRVASRGASIRSTGPRRRCRSTRRPSRPSRARVTCPCSTSAEARWATGRPTRHERLAAFRSVRAVDSEDAGHMMHWTAPGELTRLLLEHFRA